jgi:probable HAF family extracellular repeat protein
MTIRTALLALTFVGVLPFAHAQYSLTKLEGLIPTGTGWIGNARLNNFEQIVVGTRLWDHGVVSNLSVPGDFGFTESINDKGQIVGRSIATQNGSTASAMLWHNGSAQVLTPLFAGSDNYATDINEKGQIVGYSLVPNGNLRAVTWSSPNANPVDIGALPGQNASLALAVNDQGLIAGVSFPNNGAGYAHRAFVDQGGVLTPITDFAVSDVTVGDMNNHGTIVGYRDGVGYVYNAGNTTTIGNFGGPFSFASSVNEYDEVVGRSSDANGTLHPFLFKSGVLTNLGEILDSQLAPGLSLSVAWDINDRGDILVSDSRNNIYLARSLEPHHLPGGFTPVPEASTYGVFGAMGLMVFAYVRRRRA